MKNYTYVEKNCTKTKLFFSIVMLVTALTNLYLTIKHNETSPIFYTFITVEILLAICLIVLSVRFDKSLMSINAVILNFGLLSYSVSHVFKWRFEFNIALLVAFVSIIFMILFEFKRTGIIKVIATTLSISFIVLAGIIVYDSSIILGAAYSILSIAPICLISGTYKKVDLSDVKAVENMNLKFYDKQNSDNIPERIKEYKELLDMGIITEEEYEKKKTELLNK